MKKNIFFILVLMLLIGCAKQTYSTWTFHNESSETVYIFNISKDGQPSHLVLDLSSDRNVTIKGNQIDYDYGPADVLRHVRDNSANKIIFYNKKED